MRLLHVSHHHVPNPWGDNQSSQPAPLPALQHYHHCDLLLTRHVHAQEPLPWHGHEAEDFLSFQIYSGRENSLQER